MGAVGVHLHNEGLEAVGQLQALHHQRLEHIHPIAAALRCFWHSMMRLAHLPLQRSLSLQAQKTQPHQLEMTKEPPPVEAERAGLHQLPPWGHHHLRFEAQRLLQQCLSCCCWHARHPLMLYLLRCL
jgi:hypothetical protein